MARTINLADYKSNPKSRVFSGRDRGEAARKRLSIDEEDLQNSEVLVRIPSDTISLNSSFFLGLFGDSVRKLGSEKFQEKYNFDCSDRMKIAVKDGIQRALKISAPLKFIDKEK